MRKISKYRLIFILGLYVILGLCLSYWMSNNGFSKSMILTYVISNIVGIVFFTFVLSRIHLFYHSKSAISIVHIGIITMFSLLGVWLAHLITKSFFLGQEAFIYYLNISFPIAFFVYFCLLLLSANQFWIDKHIQVQEKTLQQLLKKERDLSRAELSNIQEQFRPHFIFNSLNSISALTTFDPEKAREMIHLLSDFLRANVIREDDKFHTLKEELHLLNLYLSIEKVRFEDRLTVELPDVTDMENTSVPILILQPIMENAIKYGLYGMTGNVKITMKVEQFDGAIQIEVTNPFDKISVFASKGKGFGIDSIRKKMYLFYQRNDLVQLFETEDLFTFRLIIPNS